MPTFKGDRPLEPGEQRREWAEMLACEGCGYVKRTKIVRWQGDQYLYRELCTPCEQERSARVHEQTAVKLRTKAQLARYKRKGR